MKKFICLFFVILLSLTLFGCGEDKKVTNHIVVEVNDIVISKTHAYVDVGDTIILTAQVYPFNADNQKIKWKSDNSDIAEVNSGIVLGKKEGRTVITCLSEDGEMEDKCILYVSSPKLNYNNYPNNLKKVNLIKPKNISEKVLTNVDDDLLDDENEVDFIENYFSKMEELNKQIFGLENEFMQKIINKNNFDFEKNLDKEKQLLDSEKQIVDSESKENISNNIDNLENKTNLNLNDETDKNHIYFYEYKYNSNGITDKDDEFTTYKDDNTIIKEFYS